MLLSLAIFLPIVCGALLLALGRDEQAATVRWMALVGAVLSFLVTLPLITGFDTSTAAMQFVENLAWIERFNIRYHLGVDGISMWFVPLTAFITIIVVISAWEVIENRVNQYMGAFLILSGLMIGVFSALDGMLFYVFFEATLLPMYIIIGVWGGPRRVYAAFKFFLYTLAGSLLMLVALLYLYYQSAGSFDIQHARERPFRDLTWHFDFHQFRPKCDDRIERSLFRRARRAVGYFANSHGRKIHRPRPGEPTINRGWISVVAAVNRCEDQTTVIH